jgi:REP element-mobilizing transposase RayT
LRKSQGFLKVFARSFSKNYAIISPFFSNKEGEKIMARSKRIKETAAGVAYYHVISRTNNKVFLFDSPKTKDALVNALKRSAAFSGVEIEAYAIMSNHIHAVIKVTRPGCVALSMGSVPSWAEAIPEAELLRRVEALKGVKAREELAEEWRVLRKAGLDARLELEQNRLRVRMNDVSEFVKTFKETFDRIYKKEHEYCGSIWSGRFTSTLIEDGEYLARCRKYVFFNPVRAGIVSRAAEYRWVYDRNLSEVGGSAGSVPNGADGSAGAGPEAWLMRRVAQIGAGKVFGSAAFVKRVALGLGHLFPAKRVVARAVGEIGFATHGWRLAKRQESIAKIGEKKSLAA